MKIQPNLYEGETGITSLTPTAAKTTISPTWEGTVSLQWLESVPGNQSQKIRMKLLDQWTGSRPVSGSRFGKYEKLIFSGKLFFEMAVAALCYC